MSERFSVVSTLTPTLRGGHGLVSLPREPRPEKG